MSAAGVGRVIERLSSLGATGAALPDVDVGVEPPAGLDRPAVAMRSVLAV